ncbi:NHLP leader peptide family RiPP precursor [Archangium violaceum]|uniref:NHLP leader peptide family RiPP precursor n=1 Tax=Archangium violaceum TaxID=83451 RepID=UPI0006992317|nr:NHLP leader peptide family RiPP precursor [Archangium violaceum]
MPDTKKGEAFAKLVLRVWSDPDFKARLFSDPMPLLAEYGVETPPGLKVKVVENEPGTIHLVLPSAPKDVSLLQEEPIYTIQCAVCHSRDSCLTHHS